MPLETHQNINWLRFVLVGESNFVCVHMSILGTYIKPEQEFEKGEGDRRRHGGDRQNVAPS